MWQTFISQLADDQGEQFTCCSVLALTGLLSPEVLEPFQHRIWCGAASMPCCVHSSKGLGGGHTCPTLHLCVQPLGQRAGWRKPCLAESSCSCCWLLRSPLLATFFIASSDLIFSLPFFYLT